MPVRSLPRDTAGRCRRREDESRRRPGRAGWHPGPCARGRRRSSSPQAQPQRLAREPRSPYLPSPCRLHREQDPSHRQSSGMPRGMRRSARFPPEPMMQGTHRSRGGRCKSPTFGQTIGWSGASRCCGCGRVPGRSWRCPATRRPSESSPSRRSSCAAGRSVGRPDGSAVGRAGPRVTVFCGAWRRVRTDPSSPRRSAGQLRLRGG